LSKAELVIAGKRYALNCTPGQEARLVALGERFDARVTELLGALGDIGPERLFLAAGISLLDELEAVSGRTGSQASDGGIEGAQQRLALLERRAAAALSDAADRILAISRRVDEVG
jgi:cell division protein ZapA